MRAEKVGAVGIMTFNNPARHNAVSLEMWDAAAAIVEDFLDDDAIRVVILTGAGGKAFVSGADISEFESERASQAGVADYNRRARAVYDRMESLEKPTIAMIDGYCIGGGLALAASCDLRFCSAKSQFALPAVKLGLGYPFGGLKRLVDLVGAGAARDITFSGRRLSAEEALRVGLVQRVVPDGELEDQVMDYARQVAANAPLTVKAMKLIINQVLAMPEDRDLARCQALEAAAFASEDYIEGRRAFMEKRPPVFKGR